MEDCREGLVCIDKKCSSDLQKITGEPPMMAGQGAGGAAPGDGATDAPSNPGETGAPQGGAPNGGAPQKDGSPPSNGGTPQLDAASG